MLMGPKGLNIVDKGMNLYLVIQSSKWDDPNLSAIRTITNSLEFLLASLMILPSKNKFERIF